MSKKKGGGFIANLRAILAESTHSDLLTIFKNADEINSIYLDVLEYEESKKKTEPKPAPKACFQVKEY